MAVAEKGEYNMATVVDKNKKWYAVIKVLDEHGKLKQKWICT